MFFRIFKIILLTILISVLFLPNFTLYLSLLKIWGLKDTGFVFAEENLEKECLSLTKEGCQDMDSSQCRKVLEKCEEYYRKESEKIEADITKTEQEKKTLQNEIYSLNKKIQNLNYQINQSNLIIKDLGIQVDDTEVSIVRSVSSIEDSKEKLSNILRTIYEEDQKPMVEILLSKPNLSDFFDNLIDLEILNSKNKELLQHIKNLKSNLEQQKESLDEEKYDLEKTVKLNELQKEENAQTKSNQEYYLGLTEREYQEQLREKADIDKKAAEIRARIFELVGVPKAPTFGEAYEIAKYVEKVLKVRPAFLLAVLQQESAIGKNVGQCYLKNSSTGDGIVINSGRAVSRAMKPSRDVAPFLIITKELGRDPYETPVSCPMSFGYGGAMGPAQFIPSTWMLYKDRLKSILGKPCDPWNIRDAFLAAGLYLADGGATAQTRNGEWRAAMIYFSGSTTNSAYYWYADQVLAKADGFQKDIEALEAAK